MTVENPYDALGKLFHEPNRLAIMSALCAATSGMTFGELKEVCGLTDGNLNRHLKVLEEESAVKIKKEFVGAKPRTTVLITAKGLTRFHDYLDALSVVLRQAKKALPAAEKRSVPLSGVNPVKA